MNAPIFFCVFIHVPSNELLTTKGHLKIIKIQRRLPNSDQIAHCNQRSYPNKRPPPLAKVARYIRGGTQPRNLEKNPKILLSCYIVSRGEWLGKQTNIKVENNGAVVYVGSSLTVHNPLFFVHKL